MPGTLAVDVRGKLAVVLEHKLNNPKNPVIYTASPGGTRYKGPTSFFKAVVGTVDMTAFNEAAGPAPKRAGMGTDEDWAVPAILKGVKIGDKIRIRTGRRGEEIVTYDGYNRRRPKYPVSFTAVDGTPRKGTLGIVIGPVNGNGTTPVKRAEKDILRDIAGVYCSLSPENLTCDGELSRSAVSRKRVTLHRELNALFAELGRRVDETEAYKALGAA
jgi:hypothetical protein